MFLAAKWLQAASLLTLLPAVAPLPLTPSPAAILTSPSSDTTALSPLLFLLPPFNATTTTTNTTTPTYKTFPPPPFTLPIPLTNPPQTLKILHTYRTGLSAQKYALLDLINEQIEYYNENPTLPPKPFTLTAANVRFSMRLASPKREGEDPLTRSVAVGALEVFYALVEAFGAVECDFLVGGEGGVEVEAGFWVRFLEGGGGGVVERKVVV